MIDYLRQLGRNIPTFLLALILAVAAWISAVTTQDPTEQRVYPRSIEVEVIGQDPGLVLISTIPNTVSVTLRAPNSIWDRLLNEQIPVRAVLDLSGLDAGTYNSEIQVQVGLRPVEIISCAPCSLTVTLENLSSRELPVNLVERGDLAVGFQAESPAYSPQTVVVSGPESLVAQVSEARAVLDYNQADRDINRSLPVSTYNADGEQITGVSLSPEAVDVSVKITQRGGYRNVVVKVVPVGQVAGGYRVTNISVFPPTVTIYSSDPKLVDEIPGYVETKALDLNGAKDDLDLRLPLDLPPGVSVVGEQTVAVQVGIAAIEGSLTLTDKKVEVIGLPDSFEATTSPETVDVILSGPLPVLDQLISSEVRVVVDLTGEPIGTYQRVPTVQVNQPDVRIESILPGSIEVIVRRKSP
ncbi:MAG: hypothetical protein GYA48_02525 [Chloroflexi bacterium]|nr:hypothetical protein [Chloroflexota bacterium]